ncbi:MAG TPA: antitoxin [Mycobacterium sp.]|nr:antitoxin [Mycobacterium sp.]
MKTLYLRNVPDEVVERLSRLAAREHMSLSAVAIRELDVASRWVDNAAILDELPDLDVDPAEIIKALEDEREAR